jgi:SAM-dependent methyltransferase
MTSGVEWQAGVGRTWAEMYRLTDRSFAGLTQRLLERLAIVPGQTILDIGCGAGELSLALGRTRPLARITGLDVSADLVSVARSRAGDRSTVQFRLADAAQWQPDHDAPDLLVSRHGVMFFDNPVTAFAHLRSIAAPRASLLFSSFRAPAENPWASEVGAILPHPPAPPPRAPHYAPGPFAFSDTEFLRAILSRAGWSSIAFEAFDFAYVAGQGDDPVSDAEDFFSRIGPFAAALRECPEDQHEDLRRRLRAVLDRHVSGNLVVFPAAAWIVSARNG